MPYIRPITSRRTLSTSVDKASKSLVSFDTTMSAILDFFSKGIWLLIRSQHCCSVNSGFRLRNRSNWTCRGQSTTMTRQNKCRNIPLSYSSGMSAHTTSVEDDWKGEQKTVPFNSSFNSIHKMRGWVIRFSLDRSDRSGNTNAPSLVRSINPFSSRIFR